MRFCIKRKSFQIIPFLFVCTLFNLMLVACGINQPVSGSFDSAVKQSPTTISAATKTNTATTRLTSSTTTLTTSTRLTASPTTVTTLPVDWQTRWLRSIPCQVPCWEGITPGKTTVEEATILLKQNPLIDPNSIATQFDYYDTNLQILEWKWINKIPGGQIYYERNSPQPFIKEIEPYYDDNYEEKITLNTVVQLVGSPNYILAYGMKAAEGPPVYGATFLFTQQGLAVNSNNVPRSKPRLEPGMFVTGPIFFIPQESPRGLGKPYSTGSQMWQGFKNFDYYCRDADNLDKTCLNSKL